LVTVSHHDFLPFVSDYDMSYWNGFLWSSEPAQLKAEVDQAAWSVTGVTCADPAATATPQLWTLREPRRSRCPRANFRHYRSVTIYYRSVTVCYRLLPFCYRLLPFITVLLPFITVCYRSVTVYYRSVTVYYRSVTVCYRLLPFPSPLKRMLPPCTLCRISSLLLCCSSTFDFLCFT
jgi:hypothetical protein